MMKRLVNDLKLSLNEETEIIGEIEKWEKNGNVYIRIFFFAEHIYRHNNLF